MDRERRYKGKVLRGRDECRFECRSGATGGCEEKKEVEGLGVYSID